MKRSSNSRIWKPARTRMAISSERRGPVRCSASISSPTQRASSSPSQTPRTRDLLAARPRSVHSVLPRRPSLLRDQAGGGGEDVRRSSGSSAPAGSTLRAGEILLEAQDVADLGAAPAIDRLVVVADAADVACAPAPAGAARDTARRWCPGTRRPGCSGTGADSSASTSGCCLEQREIVQQQVAEIAGVQRLQALLVGGVELRHAAVGEARRASAAAPGRASGRGPSSASITPSSSARRPALRRRCRRPRSSASSAGSGRRCRGW